MKKISLSSVYLINFLFCSNMPRAFSSFFTFYIFLSAFLFIVVALEIKDRLCFFSASSTYWINSFCSISLVFLSCLRLTCTFFISWFKMISAASFCSAFADLAIEVWWSLYLWCYIFTLNIILLILSIVCGCRLLETRSSLIKRWVTIDSTFMFWASTVLYSLNQCPWLHDSKIFTTTACPLYLLILHFLK